MQQFQRGRYRQPYRSESVRDRQQMKNNLNPQRFEDISQKSLGLNQPIYRIRNKAPKSKYSKSESGRTVYEIYNLKNRYSKYSESSDRQSSNLSNLMRNRVLKYEDKIEQPPIVQEKEKKPSFLEIVWQMKQSTTKDEQIFANSRKGQIKKQIVQSPLSPSEPESMQIKIREKKQEEKEKQKFYIASDNQIKELEELKSINKNNKTYVDHKNNMIKFLNESTRYTRFKHTQKMKQKLQSFSHRITDQQKIYKCKDPLKIETQNIEIQIGDTVQKISNILHQKNETRLKISLKIPSFFHSPPDQLLPNEELRFKAVFYFQEIGFQNIESDDVQVIKHGQGFMFALPIKNKKMCINWYSDDSIYCGEVQNNVRHGVGMEWVPGSYAYYGQYHQNYRHGYGIIKYNNEKVYVGIWAYDKYHGYGKLINNDGSIIERGTYRNAHLRKSTDFRELL